jgi:hypothetical protein
MILENPPAAGVRFNIPLNSLSAAQFYLISETAVLLIPLGIG